MKKRLFQYLVPVLLGIILLSGCAQNADPTVVSDGDNLLGSVQKSDQVAKYNFLEDVEQPESYALYGQQTANFSVKMLQSLYDKEQNTVMSPVSVSLFLGMLENGAGGGTQKEIKKVIGSSTLSVDNINACGNYLTQKLTAFNEADNALSLANALWVDKEISVKRGFLQKNKNFFAIPTFALDFADENTPNKITNLIKTDSADTLQGIDSKTTKDTKMYGVAALALNGTWLTPYAAEEVKPGIFTTEKGKTESVTFLTSTERYIKTANAQGFIKALDQVPYKLVALVPNKGIELEQVVNSLEGSFFSQLSENTPATDFTRVSLPKFSITSQTNLKEVLQGLGAKTMFNKDADFSKLTDEDICLEDLVQSAQITLDENGVCTNSGKEGEGSKSDVDKQITLDRPFIYAIVENESGIPILLGTVNNPVL